MTDATEIDMDEDTGGDDAAVLDSAIAPVSSKTKGKMDEEKWERARHMAEVEGIRGSKIAEHFDISPSLVSRFFIKEGIVVGSKKREIVEKAVDAAAERSAAMIADFIVSKKRRINETKIQHYDHAARIVMETMLLMKKAKDEKLNFSVFNNDVKFLHKAMAIVRQGREERLKVLDAETEIDEASLPVIQFFDLTDEDISNIQKNALSGDASEDGEVVTEYVDEDGV